MHDCECMSVRAVAFSFLVLNPCTLYLSSFVLSYLLIGPSAYFFAVYVRVLSVVRDLCTYILTLSDEDIIEEKTTMTQR